MEAAAREASLELHPAVFWRATLQLKSALAAAILFVTASQAAYLAGGGLADFRHRKLVLLSLLCSRLESQLPLSSHEAIIP